MDADAVLYPGLTKRLLVTWYSFVSGITVSDEDSEDREGQLDSNIT